MKTNGALESDHVCLQKEDDCKALADKIIRSLDGSLSHKEELEVIEQIQKYPCCLEKMNIARAYKAFICHKVQKLQVPDTLIDSIKNRIDTSNL